MQTKKISLMFILFYLAIAATCTVVNAQAPTENITTFFDTEVPARNAGLKIQVNATTETQPTKIINVTVKISALFDVNIKYFNFSILGMLYGRDKNLLFNITEKDLPLSNGISKEYHKSFPVPRDVWDRTYGEITLTYSAKIGFATFDYEGITCGFPMTYVENVYLKSLEEKLQNLNGTFEQLNQTFYSSFGMNLTMDNLSNLNKTYWEYKKNYTGMQGTINELNNTRMAVIVLAVVSVIFVATTVYLVMRKPREYY